MSSFKKCLKYCPAIICCFFIWKLCYFCIFFCIMNAKQHLNFFQWFFTNLIDNFSGIDLHQACWLTLLSCQHINQHELLVDWLHNIFHKMTKNFGIILAGHSSSLLFVNISYFYIFNGKVSVLTVWINNFISYRKLYIYFFFLSEN